MRRMTITKIFKREDWRRIDIPKDWQQKAWSFASNVNTDYYSTARAASSKNMQVAQHFIGKLGEYAVKQYLNATSNVDLNIYDTNNKTWNADLRFNDYKIHVKACAKYVFSEENTFPVSWIFQYKNASGEGGTDKLFTHGTDKDIIALTYVKTNTPSEKNAVKICALVPWTKVKPLLTDPYKQSLVGIKKCLIWDDLASLIE